MGVNYMINTKDKQNNIITITLVIINIFVYIMQSTHGNMKNTEYLITCGGNYWPLTFSGEWTRLISSMFMHSGLLHIASNMIFLFLLGSSIERIIGKIKYLVIYFGSGLIGGALGAYINMLMNNHNVSVGASGAIYGIMATALLLEYKLGKEKLLYVILAPLIYAFFTYTAGVDILSHILGAFVGSILALLLIRKGDIIKEDGEINSIKDKPLVYMIKNGIISIIVLIILVVLAKNIIGVGNRRIVNQSLSNQYVKMVYDGHPDGYSVTYGEAFEDFFSKPEWNHFTSSDHKEIVEFSGKCLYDEKDVDAYMQFEIIDNTSFTLSYLAFNNETQTYQMINQVIENAFNDAGVSANIESEKQDSDTPSLSIETSASSEIDWNGTYANGSDGTVEIKIVKADDEKFQFSITASYGDNVGSIEDGVAYIQNDGNTAIFQGDDGFILNISWYDSVLTLTEECPNSNPYCGVGVTFEGTYWKDGAFPGSS